MELFWYIVLVIMLAVYVILDGYDFGAGIIHLFFAKTEKDKKAITSAIGPFWDANEVWLIASGGVLFFAFPTLYASSFSGFYLPLIMILWLLIFRAIGLELRGQVHNRIWEVIWIRRLGSLVCYWHFSSVWHLAMLSGVLIWVWLKMGCLPKRPIISFYPCGTPLLVHKQNTWALLIGLHCSWVWLVWSL